jgi:hypothetical protein
LDETEQLRIHHAGQYPLIQRKGTIGNDTDKMWFIHSLEIFNAAKDSGKQPNFAQN